MENTLSASLGLCGQKVRLLTELAWRDSWYPRSSAESGHDLLDLKRTFQMSLCEEPKNPRKVWCLAGSNSHRLQVWC